MNRSDLKKTCDTIVIGGSQAGLAMGYYLKKNDRDFLILDAGKTIGETWRSRWDSLRLFTQTWANQLPGMEFTSQNKFPTKDETADYLEAYATKFNLPVTLQSRVTALKKSDNGYELTVGKQKLRCKNVIVATGHYAKPKIPSFAAELNSTIHQVHSSQYLRPSNLPDGNVLVVGAANSGLQIAIDLAGANRETFVAGNPPSMIPPFVRNYMFRFFFWVNHHIMTIKTKPGQKLKASIKKQGGTAPLVKTSLQDTVNAGVKQLPRVIGVKHGLPLLDGGQVLKPNNIIWATGFAPDFSWIQLDDLMDDTGYPINTRGITKYEGLYFIGMFFQYSLTSSFLRGVGRDAEYIMKHLK